MLEITWNTYVFRRDLRWFGCAFSYEKGAYLWKETQELIQFCSDKWLQFVKTDDVVLDESFAVQQKNIKAQQRADKYRDRALNYENKAEHTVISQHERDFLVLAEPIKVGHYSEWRHRHLIKKSQRTMDKQMELYNKSNEAERKAEYRENKKFYTEDEKKAKKEKAMKIRKLAEDLRKKEYNVWGVYVWRHTSGTIQKINNKTVILVSGWKRDIAYSKDFDDYIKRVRLEHKI